MRLRAATRRDLTAVRPRVAHLIGDLAIGGAQRQLATLLTTLDADGVVFTWRDVPAVVTLPAGVTHLIVPKSFTFDPTFPIRLRRALAAWRPDVVHAWLNAASAWAVSASVGAPWRVVTSELVTRTPPWKLWPHHLADAVVADSEAALAQLPAGALRLGPAVLARADGPVATLSGRVALILGGVHPDKGTLDALDASVAAGLRAVVVGPELDRRYGARVNERVAVLGPARAERLPATPDPWPYLRRADVVVLASRTESAPTVVIEALLAGRAVVATDVGDVRRLLRGGTLGAVVRPGDLGALTAAIAQARPHPDAIAWATASFGAGRMASDALALYRRLGS